MINYNIKGKGGEEQDLDLLSSGGGERLGLVVEEEERLGLALVMSVFNCTTSSVDEFRARQARTRLYYTECESSVSFFLREKGVGLGESSTAQPRQ